MNQKQTEIDEGERCSICEKQFITERNIEGADVEVVYYHEEPVACNKCWTPECGYKKQDEKCWTQF